MWWSWEVGPFGGEVRRVEPFWMGLVRALSPFHHVRLHREDSCLWTRKGILTRTQPYPDVMLAQFSKLWEIHFSCFISHPVYGIQLQWPQAKTAIPTAPLGADGCCDRLLFSRPTVMLFTSFLTCSLHLIVLQCLNTHQILLNPLIQEYTKKEGYVTTET